MARLCFNIIFCRFKYNLCSFVYFNYLQLLLLLMLKLAHFRSWSFFKLACCLMTQHHKSLRPSLLSSIRRSWVILCISLFQTSNHHFCYWAGSARRKRQLGGELCWWDLPMAARTSTVTSLAVGQPRLQPTSNKRGTCSIEEAVDDTWGKKNLQ